MTLGTLLADLGRRLNYQASPSAEVTTRLTYFLNEALQEVVSQPDMGAWLARNEPQVSFASVVGQSVYGVPVARIDALTERTNRTRLELRLLDWYRRAQPDPTTDTGTPSAWVPLGFSPVLTQPGASTPQSTGLWAGSSSASDTAIVVRVETIRSGGVAFSGSLTLNGTTRVQLGTATDHDQVTKFYLSAAAVGAVTLYTASSGGTVLATIPLGATFSRYFSLALWPTPSAAITYYVESERDLPEMANATDEPPLPVRFHRMLIDGALRREYEKRDDPQLSIYCGQRFQKGLSDLRYFINCPPDLMPVVGGRRTGMSRLGGNYPDGSGIW